MSCGCNSGQNRGGGYTPQQPEKIRMTWNVNGGCHESGASPRSCTRREWLRGIDCSQWSFSTENCEVGVEQGGIAPLRAIYRDGACNLVDPIEPRITIKDPYNDIYLSSQPMARTEQGKYVFMFGTDGRTTIGVWTAIVTGVVGTTKVTNTYFFCVLPLGSLPFDYCSDGYGYDYHSYGYGYGIECGADGYGTFAGREECGFDGNRSKDIPSTGGCRTNRNPLGDGFWDGISYKEQCITPISQRGQCIKDKCVAMLRVRLKDIVPECVVGDTLINTDDGAKRAQDIIIGDKLQTYNPATGKEYHEVVIETTQNATKTGKIYNIRTQRGRQISITGQHLFVTNASACFAKELQLGMKLAIDPTSSKYTQQKYPETTILTEEQFEAITQYSQNEALIKCVQDLKERGLLPLKNTHTSIKELIRIIGFLFGGGCLQKDMCSISFSSDERSELEGIIEDIKKFTNAECNIQETTNTITACNVRDRSKNAVREYKGVSAQFSIHDAHFARFLQVLGAPVDDKAVQSFCIPQWIKENKNFLREFLAIYYENNGRNVVDNKKTLDRLEITFDKDEKLESSTLNYCSEIIESFGCFGVEMQLRIDRKDGAVRKDGTKTAKYTIVCKSPKRAALINFMENIGLRHHQQKLRDFAAMCEYQREIEGLFSKRAQQQEKAKILHIEGHTRMEISKMLNVPWSTIDNWVKTNFVSKHLNMRQVISFSEWMKTENARFDTIESIECVDDMQEVYCPTVNSGHIITTGSILSYNCWAFTEDEIDMQLETSLADFNAWPMFTCYTWDTVPQEFIGVIVLGAQVFSLFAQGLLESGREFTITDNGISFNPPQISGYMQTAASTLLQTYTEMKEKIKANLKPHPAGIGTFRVTSILPALTRLRHLRAKQII